MSAYYSTDWHPLLVAAPYIGAGAAVVATELAVRRARNWWNGLTPDREPSLQREAPHLVSEGIPTRIFDWEQAGVFASAPLSFGGWGTARGRRAKTRCLSVTDQRVQSELWPNVTPLREVAGRTNNAHPAV